ncbi:MAG: hypothetical protein WB507_06055 [Solirubrobacterales bacterium]
MAGLRHRLPKQLPTPTFSATVAPPAPIAVLGQAYWVYGQLVYLVLLDVAASEDWTEFAEMFLNGVYNIFPPVANALDPQR